MIAVCVTIPKQHIIIITKDHEARKTLLFTDRVVLRIDNFFSSFISITGGRSQGVF